MKRPSILADAFGWWCLLLVLFFGTFPLWRRPAVWVLAFVLDGLNNLSIT